jgi:lipopolysaccharide/colanic/teichoic acid biosynthesis glycosyltransferase
MTGNNGHTENVTSDINHELIEAITLESNSEMAHSIVSMVGNKTGKPPVLLSTGTVFNIKSLPREGNDYIINLRKMNLIKNPDEFLDAINSRLRTGGYYFCCVETKNKRKERFLNRFPPVINYIFYSFDFIFNRIMPKLRLTRGLYLYLTGGKNMVISRAEALGRICRAGFRITQESFVGDSLCIEAVKKSEPSKALNHNYGLLIALKRIGRGGSSFKVYKLRTMHPYSEFIQEYVYSLHDLKEGGKFQHDFRITSWGGFCRKVWLDELPMIINFFKGDMKIVGVRPLSKQYFNLYSKEMQERRIKYKPGLLPPYYVDMPANLDEIQESERRYLDAYDRSPFLTDISYFFRSVWNIIFRHARSN